MVFSATTKPNKNVGSIRGGQEIQKYLVMYTFSEYFHCDETCIMGLHMMDELLSMSQC
jgi:hypothetical protein